MKPTSSQYAQALLELSQESVASEQASVAERFLAFLKRQRETRKLPAILRNLQRLTDEAEGVNRVRMTTSETLDERSLETLTKKIKILLETEKIVLSQQIDPQVLGGVALQTDTELFDGTVRRKLRELRKSLFS